MNATVKNQERPSKFVTTNSFGEKTTYRFIEEFENGKLLYAAADDDYYELTIAELSLFTNL